MTDNYCGVQPVIYRDRGAVRVGIYKISITELEIKYCARKLK